MLLATALALLITGCAQQTFTVQNKPASISTKGNHHPSFLRFWNWAERGLSMQQNLWQKMLLKQETAEHIRKNGLLGFITLVLPSRWKRSICIAHNNCMSCPSAQTLYLHYSLIYFWVPSSCFCIMISLSPEG